VGRVKAIERKNDSAFVTLEMWVPVHLKKDYIINERDRGLMGDREIQMLPGTPGGQEIDISVPITGTFVPGISENMAAANNLQKEINELHTYIADMAYGKDGRKSFPNQFNDVLEKLDEVSQKLETLIAGMQDPVNNGVVMLNKVSKDARTVSTSVIKSADDLIAQLEKTLVQLDTIMAKAGPALDTVGGIADRMLTDSTLVARTLRKTSFLDTLAQSVESLHKELLLMRKKGHLNINLF
jgi:ABC-type transporter Mla subunit MlaD